MLRSWCRFSVNTLSLCLWVHCWGWCVITDGAACCTRCRITNHGRLGSVLLMCCMYSCLCCGSKRQKAADRLFYSWRLQRGAENVISERKLSQLLWRRPFGILRYFKHEIMDTRSFTRWWKVNETFRVCGSLRWLLLFIKDFVFVSWWSRGAARPRLWRLKTQSCSCIQQTQASG